METMVRAFPLAEGKEDALEEFARSLREERRAEAEECFARYDIVHESWHRQDIGGRPHVLVVTIRSSDEPSLEVFARSDLPFDVWFKERVGELSGVDLAASPEGPPSTNVYAWHAAPSE